METQLYYENGHSKDDTYFALLVKLKIFRE